MPNRNSNTAVAILRTLGGIEVDCFVTASPTNAIGRTVFGKITSDVMQRAEDGNRDAAGTITKPLGVDSELLMITLMDSDEAFNMVYDIHGTRTPETPVVDEVLTKLDGTVPDGIDREFYSLYHALEDTVVVEIDRGAGFVALVRDTDLVDGDYILEFDNNRLPGKGMRVKVVPTPQVGDIIRMSYTPESDSAVMQQGARMQPMTSNPDGSSNDVVMGEWSYLARHWIWLTGPVHRAPTGLI